MKTLLFACLAALALVSCDQPAVSTTSTNNTSVKVDLLFENDGVKVYRFVDGGRNIYYTDARGRVEYNTAGSKNNPSKKISVETVE